MLRTGQLCLALEILEKRIEDKSPEFEDQEVEGIKTEITQRSINFSAPCDDKYYSQRWGLQCPGNEAVVLAQ